MPPRNPPPPPPSSTTASDSFDFGPSSATSPQNPLIRFQIVRGIVHLYHTLPLPSVLRAPFALVDGPPSSAAGNPDEIAKLFPHLFGQPSAKLVPATDSSAAPSRPLKVGVVLSGGQAPGGHNVISGIFDDETWKPIVTKPMKFPKKENSNDYAIFVLRYMLFNQEDKNNLNFHFS